MLIDFLSYSSDQTFIMSLNKVDNKMSTANLYPKLSLEERREVEENLRRYLSVVREIFEHIKFNNPKILTELRRRARLRKEKAHK